VTTEARRVELDYSHVQRINDQTMSSLSLAETKIEKSLPEKK